MNNHNFQGDVIDIGSKLDLEKFKKQFKQYFSVGLIILVLLILALNSVYKIEDGRVAVVIRLGKVSKVEKSAGIHFKIPFIDQVREVNVRKRSVVEYGFKTTKEGTEKSVPEYSDNNNEARVIVDAANNNASIALLTLVIEYQVSEPVDYLFKVDDVEGTLRLALEDVIRNTVQELTLDEAKKEKDLIDTNIKPKLQQKMDNYRSGISIVSVKTQNVEFLDSVEAAYQEKENANQYKNSKLEEAEKYNNTVLPRAEANATKMLEEAKAYERQVIAQANADVAQFNALYEEYLKNPDIIKEKYYLEAMSAFITNNNIILDLTSDEGIYKFFNMDQSNAIKQNIVN